MNPRPQVLVIPRAHLESVATFQGFLPDRPGLLEQILEPKELRFMDRDAAEGDPNFKQLIPYMVIRHGSQFLAYTRGKKGSETRLHALKSIGVGGHVEPCDGPARDALQWGMMRELREELGIEAPPLTPLTRLTPNESNGWEFIQAYQGQHEGPFEPAPMEVETGAFFPLEKIRCWAQKTPSVFSPVFLEILKTFPQH
jgi:hypothetical protein